MPAILLVEDEVAMARAVRFALEREGFQVSHAADGRVALALFEREEPDLILLDIMLPVLDGLEVCRSIRRHSTVPILMLTARGDEFDRVLGLELGADDYLSKPFGMRELIARVRALLRRAATAQAERSTRPVLAGPLRLDPQRREVSMNGAMLSLRPREFDLLLHLARHPGQVFTREQLLDQVWGYDFGGGSRTVDVHVRWLRQKIETDPARPQHLQTVRSVGYRLRGP
jgi:DNA-binding response OmpR family regulator